MSRVYPKTYEITLLGYICRYCGAGPGVWCTTPGDGWAGFLHSDRYYQAKPCPWKPSGTDFPRDGVAEERLAKALSGTRPGGAA